MYSLNIAISLYYALFMLYFINVNDKKENKVKEGTEEVKKGKKDACS